MPAAGAFALLTGGAAFGLLERRPCLLLGRSRCSLLERPLAFRGAGLACFWNVRFAHCWSGLWPSGAQALPASGTFAALTAGAAFGLLERRLCLLLGRSRCSLVERPSAFWKPRSGAQFYRLFSRSGKAALQQRAKRTPQKAKGRSSKERSDCSPKRTKRPSVLFIFTPEAAKPRSSRERSERPRRPKAAPARSAATAPQREQSAPHFYSSFPQKRQSRAPPESAANAPEGRKAAPARSKATAHSTNLLEIC